MLTQEEKAKAYDEAFEKFREIIIMDNNPVKPQELAKYIFPELVGSEDERIRTCIVDVIKENDWAHIFGVKKEDCLAYLEKQKENPKSADSIPSDCVSDAKCEERWHKVGDSLPDNPREVLCKDEAGNYFIGRYYVGEGWDISNYDDEDKPHYLNPPVSKWIDFPLEKQKEQEQPEVDLEKEIDACWQNWLSPSNQKEVEGVLPKTEFAAYAHHFWNRGYNARKEE